MLDVTSACPASIVVAVSKFSFGVQQQMDPSVIEWLQVEPDLVEPPGHPHIDGKLVKS